jgi:hypothetical protein
MICYSASTVNRSNLSPGNTKNGTRTGGWLLLFKVLAEWRIMTDKAEVHLHCFLCKCSILWLKMTHKNAFKIRNLWLHFLITSLTEVSLPCTIRSTVSDSSCRFRIFIFRFKYETGQLSRTKFGILCLLSRNKRNRQGHPFSDYCAFGKTII